MARRCTCTLSVKAWHVREAMSMSVRGAHEHAAMCVAAMSQMCQIYTLECLQRLVQMQKLVSQSEHVHHMIV